MFDKLIDFLIETVDKVLPVVIVNQYDKGVLLRRGLFVRVLDGGWHFKIPFVDEVIHQTYVTTTMNLPAQSLLTKDKKHIVVKAVIKYSIFDVKVLTLETWDAVDAISDTTQGIIKDVIMDLDFNELSKDTDNTITIKARREAKKWGVEIEKVTFTNIGEIRSIRLFNETGND